MKKYEKEVQQAFLDSEEAVIRKLKNQYHHSLKDINQKIEQLMSRPDSNMQQVIYQVEYQKALKKQIEGILDTLQSEEFTTVSEYLTKCYEDGFVGAMYSLQQQGIPMCFPMDQEAIVRAIQIDSKISKGLYSRLGEDVSILKKKIAAQVSRSISTGMSYAQTAEQLSRISNIGFNNAVRIARTEGHRIQVQSGMDACYKAKEKGADVVKQWDSTLDGRTRPAHQRVDGEIRELDEPFSNGLMFPGDPGGGADEVVNCRCALLQRAKWALDEDELDTLKERAEYFGLDKADTFDDYKEKYLKAVEKISRPQTKFESFKLSGIDADYAPDIEDTFNGLMSDYPVAGLNVKTNSASREFGHFQGGIKGTKKKGQNYAVLDNEICISKTSYKNRATSADAHIYNYKHRESALANADRADLATIPHEYGHAIDHAYVLAKDEQLRSFAEQYRTAQKLTSMKQVEAINDFNRAVAKSDRRLSKEIFDELQKEYGLDYMGTVRRIDEEYGSYASSSISEFLAEAFANMRILPDADKTDFMKSFEAIFNRKFNEVFGV